MLSRALRVVVLLVVAEAEFAEAVFGAGILGEHGFEGRRWLL